MLLKLALACVGRASPDWWSISLQFVKMICGIGGANSAFPVGERIGWGFFTDLVFARSPKMCKDKVRGAITVKLVDKMW